MENTVIIHRLTNHELLKLLALPTQEFCEMVSKSLRRYKPDYIYNETLDVLQRPLVLLRDSGDECLSAHQLLNTAWFYKLTIEYFPCVRKEHNISEDFKKKTLKPSYIANIVHWLWLDFTIFDDDSESELESCLVKLCHDVGTQTTCK